MPRGVQVIDALDKARIMEALSTSLKRWRVRHPEKIHVFEEGTKDATAELKAVLASTRLLKATAGKMVYVSGWAREVADYTYVYSLLDRASRVGPEKAINWLYRVLNSRNVSARVVAALWGLAVSRSVTLSKNVKLLPFSKVPTSENKSSIVSSSYELGDEECWLDYFNHELPGAALVIRTDHFPYIGEEGEAYEKRQSLEAQVHQVISLLEGIATGSPIVSAYWFDYENDEIEIGHDDENFAWHHAEVMPAVRRPEISPSREIAKHVTRFYALPENMRSNLMRSMKRFSLSQCRHELVDRILDLVLAYEIAATIHSGDNIPASWKVSIRPALIIGGTLEERQSNRNLLAGLYKLRNKGTHGGALKATNRQVIERATKLFPQFMKAMIEAGQKLDWSAIELGMPA